MKNQKPILNVAVPTPQRQLFDYVIPDEFIKSDSTELFIPGCRVLIPFGNRNLIGLIVKISQSTDFDLKKLKPIKALIDKEPLVSKILFDFFIWSANYYHHPIGEALLKVFPGNLRKGLPLPKTTTRCWKIDKSYSSDNTKSVKQLDLLRILNSVDHKTDEFLKACFGRSTISALAKKGLITEFQKSYTKEKVSFPKALKQNPKLLNDEQATVLSKLSIEKFSCSLIDGVTGSGKTEIYLQFAELILKNQRQVFILVPEINLVQQMEAQFSNRFDLEVLTFHSNMTENQRLLNWTKAKNGEAHIIVGTRSSVFVPAFNLGLIIIDEEHDQSYKQQEGFRYSARDLAIQRALDDSIPVLLGSATPSLETIQNCIKNKYQHLFIKKRIGLSQPPKWNFIDLKNQAINNGISEFAETKIKETISNGKQALIFINRRGYAPALFCNNCGWVMDCANCDSRLTLHKAKQKLICHHCEFTTNVPLKCLACDKDSLVPVGMGTERIEEYLKNIFPTIPVFRVDKDSSKKKDFMENLHRKVNGAEPCIIIGTQMMTKGHDFKNITLVLALDTDTELFHPDFKNQERLGQLLTQVAGRGGRGQFPGEIYLQTYNSDHPLLEKLVKDNYGSFLQDISSEREVTLMPPFRHLALIRADSTHSDKVINFLKHVRSITNSIQPQNRSISYIGPLPSMLEKRAGRYRYLFQIRTKNRSQMHSLLTKLTHQMGTIKIPSSVRWSVDVDPVEL